MKKKNVTIGILAAVVLVAIIVFGVVKSAIEKKEAEEAAAEAARIAAVIQQNTEDLILPIAEMHGLYDLVFDRAENDDSPYYTNVYMVSEDFADLSDEEKLSFLVAIDDATHLNDDIFHAGTHSGDYMDFTLICNDKEYDTFTSQGESWLREDGSQIFTMKTDFAQGVHDRVFGDDSTTSSGSKSCKKCGASGVNLTAGGYCKTCVDVYYTDYYVDWDGQISADRPY